jgi:hypothetical protein
MMNTSRHRQPSKGRLGADKLGSLLTTQFHLGAMARVNRGPSAAISISSIPQFTTDAFAAISQKRKYRSASRSHQYIEQVPPTVRGAVAGNVGSLVSRIGHPTRRFCAEFGILMR